MHGACNIGLAPSEIRCSKSEKLRNASSFSVGSSVSTAKNAKEGYAEDVAVARTLLDSTSQSCKTEIRKEKACQVHVAVVTFVYYSYTFVFENKNQLAKKKPACADCELNITPNHSPQDRNASLVV